MQQVNRPKYDELDERSLERKARRYVEFFWKGIDDERRRNKVRLHRAAREKELHARLQKIIADDDERRQKT